MATPVGTKQPSAYSEVRDARMNKEGKFIEYQVHVLSRITNGLKVKQVRWFVWRRYNDFKKLDE